MAQMVFPRIRWLPPLMIFFLVLSAAFPYFLAIGKKQVPAFIPFIRHSAAYPIQSGIFSTLIIVAAILGTPIFVLRYVVVKNRAFHVEHKRYEKLNEVSLCIGLLFIIFLVYTSLNPLGFPIRSKHKWITNVLVPHHVGAVCICVCFDIYAFIQAYVTYQQKRVYKKNVFLHAVLVTCTVVSTWTAVIPLSSSLKDEMKSLAADENGLVAFEYQQYSFYSTICALSEWSFTLFSLLFILTFYNDFKKMSVRLQLKPKRTVSDSVELPTLRKQDDRENTKI